MQTSVPDLMDITKESKATLEAYGAEPGGRRIAAPRTGLEGGQRRRGDPDPDRLGQLQARGQRPREGSAA